RTKPCSIPNGWSPLWPNDFGPGHRQPGRPNWMRLKGYAPTKSQTTALVFHRTLPVCVGQVEQSGALDWDLWPGAAVIDHRSRLRYQCSYLQKPGAGDRTAIWPLFPSFERGGH